VHEFRPGSGLPVKAPFIDMIEIGAGGGSIAEVDERGLMRVGPRSAGADPGPACYGRGGRRPTLTDANLVLGYLDPQFFLGGKMALDREAAARAIEDGVGGTLGISLVQAAWGVHEIVNEDVARAFRVHAAERGVDYRGCSMVAFGGSGPIHALRVARKLRIPRVVLPLGAGVMSAVGLLVSPLSFDVVRTRRADMEALTPVLLAEAFRPLVSDAMVPLRAAGVPDGDIAITRRLDMRYRGQGFEIEVLLPPSDDWAAILDGLPALFARTYAEVFAVATVDQPLEVVNWKVEATGPRPRLSDRYRLEAEAEPAGVASKGTRAAYFHERAGYVDCPVYDRYALRPGDTVGGPALIEERESTCVIGPGDRARVDQHLNLVAEL
jgi:N-methylhydantoinase A